MNINPHGPRSQGSSPAKRANVPEYSDQVTADQRLTAAPDDALTRAWAEIERLSSRTHPGMGGGDIPLIMIAEGRLRTILDAALTAAEAEGRRAERVRIQEQGWCYQHQCYHRNYVCEHDHGTLADAPPREGGTDT